MKKFAIGAIALVLLAGCNGLATETTVNNTSPVVSLDVPTSIPDTLSNIKLYAAKTGAAAEELYNVPAHAYVVADFAKKLTPENKAKLKPWLTSLYLYLGKVREAKTKVDGAVAVGDSLLSAKASLDEAFADMKRINATQPATIPSMETK